jgi:hypothetical protein
MAAQPPHTAEEVKMDTQEGDFHAKAGTVVLSGVERDETMWIPVALTYAAGVYMFTGMRARVHTGRASCARAHELIHL